MVDVDTYQTLKLLHILGAILFVGNIVVTAVWKARADRTGQPQVVAFAQRLVTLTDLAFTGLGAALVLVTGLSMAAGTGVFIWKVRWLAWGFALFTASGVLWVAVLIPIQIKQSRLARAFAQADALPDVYHRLSRLWMMVGCLATLLPLLNLYFMVFKP